MDYRNLKNQKNVAIPGKFNNCRLQSNLKKLTNSILYESSKNCRKVGFENERFSDLKNNIRNWEKIEFFQETLDLDLWLGKISHRNEVKKSW